MVYIERNILISHFKGGVPIGGEGAREREFADKAKRIDSFALAMVLQSMSILY
jgi:hypothetical protein